MSRRKPELVDLDAKAWDAILERSKTAPLSDEDRELLRAGGETLRWLIEELEKKSASLARLRQSLSLNTQKTEKTSEVLKGADRRFARSAYRTLPLFPSTITAANSLSRNLRARAAALLRR